MKNTRFGNIWKPLWLVASVGVLAIGFGCGGSSSGGGQPAGFVAADGHNGGQAYDKFWATETGWSFTQAQLDIFNANKDFFRCKQCHGWDQLGTGGAYISRAAKTTRPHVSPLNLKSIVASHSAQELFDEIAKTSGRRALTTDLSGYDPDTNFTVGDQMPNYRAFLSDAQIWELVKALKTTLIDTSTLYDSVTTGSYPTGSIAYSNIGKNGNASNGDSVYTAKCGSCHGANGKQFSVGGKSGVGNYLRNKPNEMQHKVKFGQLGSSMGALVTDDDDMKDLYKALTNTTKYPD
jgi:mono/diheme cytochrome c family protein